ncbi:hypothetical protein PAXINDRAFT_175654 [Paxillus involutus ATCC 200175]|nr:hypothetical protein PAXINDRAFT_175654 [Paxillus involutus ATCC 200175]
MVTRRNELSVNLGDSTVDLSKMRMAQNRLEALKEELDGIGVAQAEIEGIREHVRAPEVILQRAKKPRAKVAELTKDLTTNAATEAEIVDLHSRIKKIYARANMDVNPPVLLALAEITSTERSGVAILPEMKIGPRDGVQISHPVSGYELWLIGNVDYAVIQYNDLKDYRDRLLPGGSRKNAFEIAKGHLFLVEAKRQGERDLASYNPEAVSQAIALLKSAKLPEVRFCLSDGQTWVFFVLKLKNGTLTYYESAPRRLIVDGSDSNLREIVQLVCEWLRPTTTGLFGVE